MKPLIWLMRLIFPNAGWYTYYAADWEPAYRTGPHDTKAEARDYQDDDSFFNVWVRFNLW